MCLATVTTPATAVACAGNSSNLQPTLKHCCFNQAARVAPAACGVGCKGIALIDAAGLGWVALCSPPAGQAGHMQKEYHPSQAADTTDMRVSDGMHA